jgi:hypothetical protein
MKIGGQGRVHAKLLASLVQKTLAPVHIPKAVEYDPHSKEAAVARGGRLVALSARRRRSRNTHPGKRGRRISD